MIKPKLIHPIEIGISFVDKDSIRVNRQLNESVGKKKYKEPIFIQAQKLSGSSILKTGINYSLLNMTQGGNSPVSETSFLFDKIDLPKLIDDINNLEKFKGALIVFEENYKCNYMIKDAIPVTRYNNQSYFIKLICEKPKTG